MVMTCKFLPSSNLIVLSFKPGVALAVFSRACFFACEIIVFFKVRLKIRISREFRGLVPIFQTKDVW